MKLPLFPLAVLAAMSPVASGQVQLSTGFEHEFVAAGLDAPSGFDFLPDGRILICELKTGLVRVLADGALGVVGQVPNVNGAGPEQGLISMAVDPGWPNRNFLYVGYDNGPAASVRLSMFEVTGTLEDPQSLDLVLGTEYPLIETPNADHLHNACSIRFGPDGLHCTPGSATTRMRARPRTSTRRSARSCGSTWRGCRRRGPSPRSAASSPRGNPFTGPTDVAKLVWAYGLRNPFRFHLDPVTGLLMIGDVGGATWEEIDEAPVGGLNFGWPFFEGPQSSADCPPLPAAGVPPVVSMNHADGVIAVVGSEVYRNPVGGTYAFGARVRGRLLLPRLRSGRRATPRGRRRQLDAGGPGAGPA